MKILVVARTFPWPTDSGGRIRIANTVGALQPLGDVDVFVAARSETSIDDVPAAHVHRIGTCRYPPSSLTAMGRLRWLRRPGFPLELVDRDFSSVRHAFARFIEGERYDLIWVSRLPTAVALGRLPDAPTVIDIDDLRGDWHIGRLATMPGSSLGRRLRTRVDAIFVRRNVAAWEGLQSEVGSRAAATLVCSEADRAIVGLPNARVILNGYDRPDPPVGKPAVSESPTIVFQGGLHYPPNIDAARFLVGEVLPTLRRTLPHTRIRLVGSAAPAVRALASPPEVTVTGHVDRIEEELELADLIATPIRFGGGTRIKIIEAFAHRIPVVSTSMGAYGLDVTHGRHLLLADSADAFAAACARVMTDMDVRRRLVEEAETLFLSRYQWCDIAGSMREVALEAASVGHDPIRGGAPHA